MPGLTISVMQLDIWFGTLEALDHAPPASIAIGSIVSTSRGGVVLLYNFFFRA